MRTVYCDFCHAELTDSAWHCPAEDYDYDAPRVSLGGDGPVIDGSIGSWLACDGCGSCVRDEDRPGLLTRAILGNFGTRPLPHSNAVADLSDFLDLFWDHRTGEPTRIGAEQIALVATDPTIVREPRS